MARSNSLTQAKRAQQGLAKKKQRAKALRAARLPASSALKAYRLARLDALLAQAEAPLRATFQRISGRVPAVLFLSFTDGTERARVMHATGADFDAVWEAAWQQLARQALAGKKVRFLRVDWVETTQACTWQQVERMLAQTKRNYFRHGLSLDTDFQHPLLEQEINANAVLYAGSQVGQAQFNPGNYRVYTTARFGKAQPAPEPSQQVVLFTTRGLLLQANNELQRLNGYMDGGVAGRDLGRRTVAELDAPQVTSLITQSSQFLAEQVNGKGRFVYGIHPCFDRDINTYNTLRHASTTYAMLEAWEVTRDPTLKKAIDRSISHLTGELIRTYTSASGEMLAYLIDQNNEIKLGGNAVSLLALVKYSELTHDERYLPLMEGLALGIQYMQDTNTGQMVHVLNADDLSVKEAFRIIYYDGEAAFGLMRLYGLTKDDRWLNTVVKAFDYFIAKKHWQIHDHWLSYCVNELTLYRPEERYFRFGIQNVAGHLDFVIERITTFPTLLELMMAAHKMLLRLQQSDEYRHLLHQIDMDKFYRALETRAHHLLNGFFFPEVAMFFKNPQRILGSFFIRHHGFRVRIDDVEHYLSGFVAYLQHYLPAPCRSKNKEIEGNALVEEKTDKSHFDTHAENTQLLGRYAAEGVVSWGGDVNLGRRQHYRSQQLGYAETLAIPELKAADLTVVNLECVVATLGQQGVMKGEGGPYYYRARPEMLNVLTEAEVNLVTVANNHSGDYGPDALMQQQSILQAVGIDSVGSGETVEAAFTPAFCQAGDLEVAVFSIDATQHRFAASDDSPGAAYLPPDQPQRWQETLQPLIDQARQQADVVLVAVHWGVNHAPEPDDNEISIGHAIIDAGADAILGASAHRLQGIEVYRNKPILHDAGDLLFDSVRSSLADSGIFQLGLTKMGVSWVRFVPVGVGFGFSKRLVEEQAERVTEQFVSQCQRMGTSLQSDQGDAYLLLGDVRETTRSRRSKLPTYNLQALTQWKPEEIGENYSVPEEYAIEPVVLNGLTLLGIRVHPAKLTHRRMLWVETWWCVDSVPDENLRLDYRAAPQTQHSMPIWGRGMDHDPGDWLQPTQSWKPGNIYRDLYGLRPPQFKQLLNDQLRLEVRVLGRSGQSTPYIYPYSVELRIPQLEKYQFSLQYRTDFSEINLDTSPMETWTADHLAAITGGRWLVEPAKDWFVRSVVNSKKHIAMREAPVLFVAHTNHERAFHEGSTQPIKGVGDRHLLLNEMTSQLAGAIISKPVAGLPEDFPLLQVDDPIKAIIELGFAARQRYRGPVIAVTGTAGKSSTIGLLETMFESGRVLKSLDNYNSRVGAPVQLASLAPDHQAALIEVAQSALWMQRGPVTRQIKPTIAILTEIGLSQTNRMVKTTKDVAHWKARIFDGLESGDSKENSIAIFGEHLPHFDYVLEQAKKHAKRIVTFGSSKKSTLRVLEKRITAGQAQLVLLADQKTYHLSLPFTSAGMLNNALAALAAAYVLNMDLKATADRMATLYVPDEGRMEEYVASLDGRHFDVIDDSWNAEIISMLNAFSLLEGRRRVIGRKIAILGRIVHLGDKTGELHSSLAQPLIETGVDIVITHGDEMKYLRDALPNNLLGPHFNNARQLFSDLRRRVKTGDTLLLKGSRRDSDFGDLSAWLKAISKNPHTPRPGGRGSQDKQAPAQASEPASGEAIRPAWHPGRYR